MTKQRIPLTQIERNPDQPRQFFDEEALRELADSIGRHGLMQAITVRKIEAPAKGQKARYMIVAGERRFRAHQLLAADGALGETPVIMCEVVEIDENEMHLRAIIENLQRADVTPLEEARAFAAMLDRGWTRQQLAKDVGCHINTVGQRLALLQLDSSIQALVDSGQFSLTIAWHLTNAPKDDQLKIVRLWNQGKLTTPAGVGAAVVELRERRSQPEMFSGAEARKPSQADVAALGRVEGMVERIVSAISSGWKDGEFVAVKTVDPNRASHLADTIAAAQKTLRNMEAQLRAAQGRAALV